MQAVANLDSQTAKPPSKLLHYGLWATQLLLAAMFLMAGGMKMAAPIEQLQEQMPWVSGALGSFVRVIGFTEVLGAIGLIVPAATRILPRLTPLAALGLVGVMLVASVMHLVRGEAAVIPMTLTFAGMSAFVVWGRLIAAPTQGR